MRTEKVFIGPRVYADHAPLLTQWENTREKAGPRSWKMDNFLLMNKEVVNKVKGDISIFFQVNREITDKILLWKTFKAYIGESS